MGWCCFDVRILLGFIKKKMYDWFYCEDFPIWIFHTYNQWIRPTHHHFVPHSHAHISLPISKMCPSQNDRNQVYISMTIPWVVMRSEEVDISSKLTETSNGSSSFAGFLRVCLWLEQIWQKWYSSLQGLAFYRWSRNNDWVQHFCKFMQSLKQLPLTIDTALLGALYGACHFCFAQ